MDKTTIEEIIASLDRLNILELQQLTDVLLKKYTSNIQVISEEEIRAREAAFRAYWTPWYALTLTAVNCKPGNVVALIKKVREISGCSLLKAKEKVTNPDALPFVLWKRYHIHPSEGRAEIGTVRAELEALGAVVEEDFNYGYYD